MGSRNGTRLETRSTEFQSLLSPVKWSALHFTGLSKDWNSVERVSSLVPFLEPIDRGLAHLRIGTLRGLSQVRLSSRASIPCAEELPELQMRFVVIRRDPNRLLKAP